MKNKLRLIRLIKDETIQDMADKLNIPRMYLDSIENGETPGSDELMNHILKVYGIKDYILGHVKATIIEKELMYSL